MDSEGMETDFPCRPTSKKVSFALHAGAREAMAHAGVSASPVTPIFQSEFVHGILGVQQAVTDAFSSLRSNAVAPLPLMELKQSALVSLEQILAQSKLCCESLNSANSGNHRSSSAVPDELAIAGVLNVRVVEHESGAVNVGCSLRQEAPGAVPGLHQGTVEPALPPSDSGVHGASMAPPVEQYRESKNRALPSSVERSEECGEKSNGRSWSSVVTNNPFGGIDCMVADIHRCKLLLIIKKHPSLNRWPMSSDALFGSHVQTVHKVWSSYVPYVAE